MELDEFEARSRNFLAWFKSLPGSTFSDSISIVDLRYRNGGRGIVANTNIPANTLLFTIPRVAVINPTTSNLSERLPRLFDGSGGNPAEDAEGELEDTSSDPWISLILVMIYEYLQGPQSRWKPYFDILPEQFDTPMFWSDAELAELQASSVRSKIGKAEADSMFLRKVIPVVREHADIFYSAGANQLADAEMLGLAHRMGSLIMAYAFDLDKDDENEEQLEADAEDGWVEDKDGSMLGMVPMADVLNSDAEFNAHVDHADAVLTVTSLRDIPQGEEVLNYYGPLANSDLLRRYGYVSQKHSRYDVVEVPLSMVATQVQLALGVPEAFKDKALSVLGDDVDDPVVLERDAGEPNSDGTLVAPVVHDRILSELEEATMAMLKAFKKVSASVLPDKRKRDEVCRAVVPLVISTRLAEYPTTLAEDEAMLAASAVSGRQRMAIEVRAGEKRLLQEALAMASSPALGDPALGGNAEDERPSKRARA